MLVFILQVIYMLLGCFVFFPLLILCMMKSVWIALGGDPDDIP